MNESSTATTAAALSKEEQSALKALQDILHNRIMQKKGEIHESHSEVYTGSLSKEIETLHWVLAKILTLKREYTTLNSRSNNKNSNISREEVNQTRRGRRRTTTVTTKKEQV
ncbi:MAG: hypothetical protein K0S67_403 [Nitrososphaeraceae archaeon]|jgi:hypothetical protein|nr:hypothetical protein [Nitrososphaeraceae archaeon]MCD6036519.1 hypothetical protein [Nitrososphaeraceae archaeon]MDF2768607.1 hypothetical protein [Nitrososphaeraceae archaeon]